VGVGPSAEAIRPELTRFWVSVFTELKNRAGEKTCLSCALTSWKDSPNSWKRRSPQAQLQLHHAPGTRQFGVRELEGQAVAADLKPYTGGHGDRSSKWSWITSWAMR
jgi:hypothetical protein